MRHYLAGLLLVGTLAWSAPTKHLTVLLQFEEQPSALSLTALDVELRSILAASQLPVELMLVTESLKADVAGDLVVFKMKGSCSMDALPIGALIDERGPLGSTHIVNGEVLPFADVECDRVRTSVQRTVGRGHSKTQQAQYGAALARVMAHELCHILARSTAHDEQGVTKRALSARELASGQLLLSEAASERLLTGQTKAK